MTPDKMTEAHFFAVHKVAEGARKMATTFQENKQVTGALMREYRLLSEVASLLKAMVKPPAAMPVEQSDSFGRESEIRPGFFEDDIP